MKQVLPIKCHTGPVHQPSGLIGGIVKIINTNPFSQFAGNRFIFIWRHRAVKGDENAQPRIPRCMFVSGIYSIGICRQQFQILIQTGRCKIGVQCHQLPHHDILGFSPAILQAAAHKAPNILDLILLGFTHGLIFGQRLLSPGGRLKAFKQGGPLHFPVLPMFFKPALSCGDRQRAIIMNIQFVVLNRCDFIHDPPPVNPFGNSRFHNRPPAGAAPAPS